MTDIEIEEDVSDDLLRFPSDFNCGSAGFGFGVR